MIGQKSFIISIFSFLFLVSFYKCFEVDILLDVNDKTGGGTCYDVFCSNDKISDMYENSKFLLTELENLLLDLRDEKASHQMEDAYNKQLDYEVAYPESTDYEDTSYFDLNKDIHKKRNGNSNIYFDSDYIDSAYIDSAYIDSDYINSDYDYEIDSNMSQPVPFINIYNSEDVVDQVEEYNSSNKMDEIDNKNYRPLTDGEEIDILLSQLHEMEQKEEKQKETTNLKKYFR